MLSLLTNRFPRISNRLLMAATFATMLGLSGCNGAPNSPMPAAVAQTKKQKAVEGKMPQPKEEDLKKIDRLWYGLKTWDMEKILATGYFEFNGNLESLNGLTNEVKAMEQAFKLNNSVDISRLITFTRNHESAWYVLLDLGKLDPESPATKEIAESVHTFFACEAYRHLAEICTDDDVKAFLLFKYLETLPANKKVAAEVDVFAGSDGVDVAVEQLLGLTAKSPLAQQLFLALYLDDDNTRINNAYDTGLFHDRVVDYYMAQEDFEGVADNLFWAAKKGASWGQLWHQAIRAEQQAFPDRPTEFTAMQGCLGRLVRAGEVSSEFVKNLLAENENFLSTGRALKAIETFDFETALQEFRAHENKGGLLLLAALAQGDEAKKDLEEYFAPEVLNFLTHEVSAKRPKKELRDLLVYAEDLVKGRDYNGNTYRPFPEFRSMGQFSMSAGYRYVVHDINGEELGTVDMLSYEAIMAMPNDKQEGKLLSCLKSSPQKEHFLSGGRALSSGDRAHSREDKYDQALLTEIDRIANDTQFNGTIHPPKER